MDAIEFEDFNVDFIRDREEIVFLLQEAAAFEHSVMCSYLYTLLTLKRSTEEGITAVELEAINRWRREIQIVAVQEMLHLSLVNNLLIALGASPNFNRPDFPVEIGRFPADYEFHLSPFNTSTIQHFVYVERPLGADVVDGAKFTKKPAYFREIRTDLLSPTHSDYPSQGHLYNSILFNLKQLSARFGEETIFAGRGHHQITAEDFPLGELNPVTDLASARAAILSIVTHGEGAPDYAADSHYARFANVAAEFRQLKAARPAFEAGRPAATNPVLTAPIRRKGATVITHPLAMRVVDIGNCIYALMCKVLAQAYGPQQQPRALKTALAGIGTGLMHAMSSVGELATTLPLKASGGRLRAGLTFELQGVLGLHVQTCVARLLAERAGEIAAAVRALPSDCALPGVAEQLERATRDLLALHAQYENNGAIVAARPLPATAAVPVVPESTARAPAETRVGTTAAHGVHSATSQDLAIAFEPRVCMHARHCVLGAADVFHAKREGAWLRPERARVEDLVGVIKRCPSGALTYQRRDGGPQEAAPAINTARILENGPYAVSADLRIEGQEPRLRATLCRCGHSKNKPFCDGAHATVGFIATGELAFVESALLEERGGPLRVNPLTHGPLQVSGNLEIISAGGKTVKRTQSAALCRCGASAKKPFCDGSHAKIGFRSDQ